jgi:hypothetical protein
MVSIHRIVQKMTKDRMKADKNYQPALDELLQNIDEDELFSKKEIIHIIQIWKNALPEVIIVKKNSSFPLGISMRLHGLAMNREMKDFSEITFQQFLNYLGPEHIDTLQMEHCVAVALDRNGGHEEALAKYQISWENMTKALKEKSMDKLWQVQEKLHLLFGNLKDWTNPWSGMKGC